MGDWRPRSADETTVPTWRPQPNEQRTRPLDSAEDVGQPWDMFRPRPVSTGDLEKVLPADLGLQTASTDTMSSSFLCQGTDIPHHSPDPKYQRDLVARGGQEVYLYPSPLHAVALQSPLFAVTKETPQLSSHSPPRTPPLGSRDLNRTQAGPVRELGPAGAYIDRLLHLRSQRPPQRGIIGEQGPPRYGSSSSPQKLGNQRSGGGNQPDKLVCAPGIAGGGSAQSRVASGDSFQQQGPVPLDTQTPSINPEEGPKPWNHYIHGDITVGLSPCPQTQQPHSDHGQDQLLSPSRTVDSESPSLAPGLFAHPPCTTGEVSPVRLKIGSPQSKAVKTRRRASDKVLRFGKQPAPLPDRYWGTYAAPQLPLEWDLSYRPQGGGLGRRPTLARDAPGRSCSESTLYPVPFFVPLVVSRGESCQASSQALFPVEAAPLSAGTRRKQRKWQSTVEISARALAASYPEPHLGPPRRTARRESGPQVRGRPLLARQDACAKSESDPSEHSAECASLFHSTIAETSEEEASDHTANRFGDQESSPSDSEGYIQSSGGSLAMDGAEAGPGKLNKPRVAPHRAPGGTRLPLPPMPKLCRIKASKALKRKIRRFQPTALKVMTMV
ncbi:dapper homolog 2 isoform X2 [Castor canadensis]